MSNRELFEIAIKYVEKEYSVDNLIDGDDLYSASKEDRKICIKYYSEIRDKGLKWANKYINKL